MELRQRAATGSNMYYGSRLAISLLTQRGAARVALAAGPGLLVIYYLGISFYKIIHSSFFLFKSFFISSI